jgi:hypothetical protein
MRRQGPPLMTMFHAVRLEQQLEGGHNMHFIPIYDSGCNYMNQIEWKNSKEF